MISKADMSSAIRLLPRRSPIEDKLLFTKENINIGKITIPMITSDWLPKGIIAMVNGKLIEKHGLRWVVEEIFRKHRMNKER